MITFDKFKVLAKSREILKILSFSKGSIDVNQIEELKELIQQDKTLNSIENLRPIGSLNNISNKHFYLYEYKNRGYILEDIDNANFNLLMPVEEFILELRV